MSVPSLTTIVEEAYDIASENESVSELLKVAGQIEYLQSIGRLPKNATEAPVEVRVRIVKPAGSSMSGVSDYVGHEGVILGPEEDGDGWVVQADGTKRVDALWYRPQALELI